MRYEPTDDEINQLTQALYGQGTTMRDRGVVRDWFAALPVVPREAAERALGPATMDEVEAFNVAYGNGYPDIWGAWRRGLDVVLARRRAMLESVAATKS